MLFKILCVCSVYFVNWLMLWIVLWCLRRRGRELLRALRGRRRRRIACLFYVWWFVLCEWCMFKVYIIWIGLKLVWWWFCKLFLWKGYLASSRTFARLSYRTESRLSYWIWLLVIWEWERVRGWILKVIVRVCVCWWKMFLVLFLLVCVFE